MKDYIERAIEIYQTLPTEVQIGTIVVAALNANSLIRWTVKATLSGAKAVTTATARAGWWTLRKLWQGTSWSARTTWANAREQCNRPKEPTVEEKINALYEGVEFSLPRPTKDEYREFLHAPSEKVMRAWASGLIKPLCDEDPPLPDSPSKICWTTQQRFKLLSVIRSKMRKRGKSDWPVSWERLMETYDDRGSVVRIPESHFVAAFRDLKA